MILLMSLHGPCDDKYMHIICIFISIIIDCLLADITYFLINYIIIFNKLYIIVILNSNDEYWVIIYLNLYLSRFLYTYIFYNQFVYIFYQYISGVIKQLR